MKRLGGKMILPKTFINSNDITYVGDTFYTFDYRNFPEGNLIFLNNVYVLWSEFEIMFQSHMLVSVLCEKLRLEFPFTQIRVRR